MTTLRPAPHTFAAGRTVIEIWDGEEFIGQVTAGPGRGVRVVSKFDLTARWDPGSIQIMDITIGRRERGS